MRQIILDTETTGLHVHEGHRIIEIGCLELVDRRPTGRTLHHYIQPDRAIDEGAKQVHGITEEFLADKPRFAELGEAIKEFLAGAELLIHNAAFDIGFLNAEFERMGVTPVAQWAGKITDTLMMAREMYPGKRNSLDALCERLGVSNAHRKFHGALLDAELLAEVFLAMTRGQDSLDMANHQPAQTEAAARQTVTGDGWPPAGLKVVQAHEAELSAHADLLQAMAKENKKPTLWQQLTGPAPAA
jgi:DNA polymerase III subunit epsilon